LVDLTGSSLLDVHHAKGFQHIVSQSPATIRGEIFSKHSAGLRWRCSLMLYLWRMSRICSLLTTGRILRLVDRFLRVPDTIYGQEYTISLGLVSRKSDSVLLLWGFGQISLFRLRR
jgi:hypothetical protein